MNKSGSHLLPPSSFLLPSSSFVFQSIFGETSTGGALWGSSLLLGEFCTRFIQAEREKKKAKKAKKAKTETETETENTVAAGGIFQFQGEMQSEGEGEMQLGEMGLPRDTQKQPQGGGARFNRLLPQRRPLRVLELGCGVAPAAGMACLGVGCDVLFTDLPQVLYF